MPGKVKVTPHMRNTPSGSRIHVRAQNRNAPVKQKIIKKLKTSSNKK